MSKHDALKKLSETTCGEDTKKQLTELIEQSRSAPKIA